MTQDDPIQKTATVLVERLKSLGLDARSTAAVIVTGQPGTRTVIAGTCERDEEAVFRVLPQGVEMLALKLGRTKALRRRMRPEHCTSVIARCEEIAARFRENAANRAEQAKAIEVMDALKAQGLHCVAFGGKVHITLELSPEYAAEVGPKIAAAMSARKVNV